MVKPIKIRIKADLTPLKDVAHNAFSKTLDEFQKVLNEVIQESGAFSDFPGRDIVDTGQLLKSQKLKRLGNESAEYDFGTFYAIFVHEGYTLRDGSRQPGRPWFRLALKRYNFEEQYKKNFNQLLSVYLNSVDEDD